MSVTSFSSSFLLDKIQRESRDRYRSVGEQGLDNKGEVDSTTLRRNESWVPLIENYHREGFFAVVGAAHLDSYHEKGLLSLLRARGFNVSRIDNEQRFRELLKKFDY